MGVLFPRNSTLYSTLFSSFPSNNTMGILTNFWFLSQTSVFFNFLFILLPIFIDQNVAHINVLISAIIVFSIKCYEQGNNPLYFQQFTSSENGTYIIYCINMLLAPPYFGNKRREEEKQREREKIYFI